MIQRLLLWFVVSLMVAAPGLAQDAAPAAQPVTTTAFRLVNVRQGPGHTHLLAGTLQPGVPVSIIERNAVGNWVHINRFNASGSLILDGWVMSGYLNLPPELRYGQVPVNPAVLDADPSTVSSPSLRRLYEAPLISPVSDFVRQVYATGQELGNRSAVVTKVGDSLSADPLYLELIAQDNPVLGPYEYLRETIDYFGASVLGGSIAARVGMTSYVIFDPMWADPSRCQPNETPLDCEYRLKRPSIALIMFGPNDVQHISDEYFDGNMRRLVDVSLEQGIIPVLSTFSYSPDHQYWLQAVNFNLRLVEIASEYQIPLINLWAAARPLPSYGLDVDNIHMTHSGFNYLKLDSGHEAFFGVPLRNLLALRMLDELRRQLMVSEA